VDARPAPNDYDDEPWELAAAYRITLWEQPARPPNFDRPASGPEPFPGAPMGWEEMTFELAGAQDVREVIQWAETALASGEGRVRGGGVERDVAFEVPASDVHPALDDAYHAKYDRYGKGMVRTVVSPDATRSTLRLAPR